MTDRRQQQAEHKTANRIAAACCDETGREDRGERQSTDQPAPCLAGRKRRDEFRAAENPSDDQSARIGGPDDEEDAEHDPFRMRCVLAQCHERARRYAEIKRTKRAPGYPHAACRAQRRSEKRARHKNARRQRKTLRDNNCRNRSGNGKACRNPFAAKTVCSDHTVPFARSRNRRGSHEAGKHISAGNCYAHGNGSQQHADECTQEKFVRRPPGCGPYFRRHFCSGAAAKTRDVVRRAHATASDETAPKRRSRAPNEFNMAMNCARVKSGHSVSTKASSA